MRVAVLRAAHLEPSLAVTVVAGALALAAGRGLGTVWVVAAVLAGQLSVGWSNDWLDAGRDRTAGRIDKPVATGAVAPHAVRNAAFAAFAAALALSLASGPAATAVHAVALTAAWGYNLGLKATPASVLSYAVAFSLLPAFVTLPLGSWPPWWATATAALLGAGAHFTNALPDLGADAAAGVRGLPHRLGRRASLAAAALLPAAAAVVLAVGTRPGPVALGVLAVSLGLVAAAVAVAARRRERLAFRLTIAAALAVLAGFLAAGTHLLA